MNRSRKVLILAAVSAVAFVSFIIWHASISGPSVLFVRFSDPASHRVALLSITNPTDSSYSFEEPVLTFRTRSGLSSRTVYAAYAGEGGIRTVAPHSAVEVWAYPPGDLFGSFSAGVRVLRGDPKDAMFHKQQKGSALRRLAASVGLCSSESDYIWSDAIQR